MLTAVVFTPLAGALAILLLAWLTKVIRWQGGPAGRKPTPGWLKAGPRTQRARSLALLVSVAEILLSVTVFLSYDLAQGGLQLITRADWIVPINAQYYLGVDGLSAPLVLLNGLLGLCAVLASWNVRRRAKEHFIWLLVLQTAVMGVFTSLDFVLFFVFWELELIPMYLLISIWGSGRKEYSALKFLAFTIFGSAFMLVGLLVLYFSTGTFDMAALGQQKEWSNLILPVQVVFFLFFTAFAIKLPSWPVHTWLPDAHTDAPTAGSVMLAGVLIKMGGYGLIRVCVTMFPEVAREYAWLLVALGVMSIMYGAVVTMRQNDLKRMIAYSSISHMGLVLIGISSVGVAADRLSPVGLSGAALQMFTHGTITGLLFLLVGFVYEKAHTRYIPDLGGLAARMPFLAAFLVMAGLASLGLPGLSGFVAELLVFLGTFSVWGWPTAIAVFSIVLTAGYILWMVQRVMFGPALRRYDHVGDATLAEAIPVVLLFIAILAVGVYPAWLTDVFTSGVAPIISRFG
ncbi:MAG: NADH-quinone oxidoreductase subunit M [Chloroflexi bacterium]|nr:NADH-quinone oxidoreductase subunit M [Chloroflexota bacterium]